MNFSVLVIQHMPFLLVSGSERNPDILLAEHQGAFFYLVQMDFQEYNLILWRFASWINKLLLFCRTNCRSRKNGKIVADTQGCPKANR